MFENRTRVCVVGAGVSGLVAIRELVDAGCEVRGFEKSDDVIGVWRSVYDTVHLLTSKTSTSFKGFPMPESYPAFPTGEQYRNYIRWFADAAELRQYISFNTEVTLASPVDGGSGGWDISLSDGTTEHFDVLVAANGHLNVPFVPTYPGSFSGKQLHTSEYRNPADIEGESVLVVGSGNSACDMVTDAIGAGRSPMMSLRHPTWFVPQSFFGTPRGDLEFIRNLPAGTADDFNHYMVKAVVGNPSAYGFPQPANEDWTAKPPTFSTLIPYWAQRGRVSAVPEIASFNGNEVTFIDGRKVQVDTLIWATGYQAVVPFLPADVLTTIDGRPSRLIGGLMSADADNFYYSGMVGARGGAPHNYGRGAETIAKLVLARTALGMPLREAVFVDEAPSGRMDYLLAAWIEVLEKAERKLDDAVTAALLSA